jgi:hypothetical protein
MKWYSVRCCCRPRRILGFILFPEDLTPFNFKYTVKEAFDPHLSLPPFRHITEWDAIEPKTHEVEIRLLHTPAGDEWAVYSEDRDIEFWRNIMGFVEAK